jgi:hypothetical protein
MLERVVQKLGKAIVREGLNAVRQDLDHSVREFVNVVIALDWSQFYEAAVWLRTIECLREVDTDDAQ